MQTQNGKTVLESKMAGSKVGVCHMVAGENRVNNNTHSSQANKLLRVLNPEIHNPSPETQRGGEKQRAKVQTIQNSQSISKTTAQWSKT